MKRSPPLLCLTRPKVSGEEAPEQKYSQSLRVQIRRPRSTNALYTNHDAPATTCIRLLGYIGPAADNASKQSPGNDQSTLSYRKLRPLNHSRFVRSSVTCMHDACTHRFCCWCGLTDRATEKKLGIAFASVRTHHNVAKSQKHMDD
jgi:hypothetical protein